MGLTEQSKPTHRRDSPLSPLSASHPLSPLTYCRRNIRRLAPMALVIVLSVFLVAAVVTVVDSVDLTVTTVYNYTRVFTVVIPQRSALAVPEDQVAKIAGAPGVDRTIEGSGFLMNLNTVFGATPFLVIAASETDRDYLLARAHDRLVSGRLPAPGAPEAVVSTGIVRNKRLKIGDVVAGPDDRSGIAGCSVPVKLVGILDGPTWIAFTSPEFAAIAMPFFPRHVMFTSKNPAALPEVSRAVEARIDRRQVQVLSHRNLVEQIRSTLDSMYLIMSLVNAMVILVVALMSGMLSNIYFTQRLTEFAVLSAIGVRRSVLMLHAVSETAVVTSIGWVLGMIATWFLMGLMKDSLFARRGMLIDPHDLLALAYTIPIPFVITAFAMATIFARLSRLDPLGIIERR